MKVFSFILLFFYAGGAFALGGFDSFSEPTRNILSTIVKELEVSDQDNSVKEKIYNRLDYIFSADYYAYWLGNNDLSNSKYDGKGGFIQYMVPTKESGVYLVNFSKRPDVNQIIITTSQIRHGSQKGALEVYEKNKEDSDSYKLLKETDSYAMFQKTGQVSFEIFNVGTGTGSVIYTSQTYVDL